MYELVRSVLFRLDPEDAHEWTSEQMRRIQGMPSLLRWVEGICRRGDSTLSRDLWGLRFRNPLGIAAGFDKNAVLIPFLRALGFGFIEVGTVTPEPQLGNPRPRLFRLPAQRALINRLGFNNDGATVVAARLRSLWNSVEHRGTSVEHPPLFVNIGKNREVPLERAIDAYVSCYRVVAPVADGIVVNVSSPNTPGLRDLQSPSHLEAILVALLAERERARFMQSGRHPILVKIAPDLDDAQLASLADVCVRLADGVVATNTTIARPAGVVSDQAGGLSGEPLFDRSTAVLRALRARAGAGYPLIGVGGIVSPEAARLKLEAGADLIQCYTGFIYGGPLFPGRVIGGLEELKR